MRSLAFKLFTLLLAALLLLSFSAPAFALPKWYYLVNQDLDESGYPHVASRVWLIPTSWGSNYMIIVRVKAKVSTDSEQKTSAKSSDSPRVNEEIR